MAPGRPEPRGVRRLVGAWTRLAREQRLVVVAALALLGTMLLPWYTKSVDAVVRGTLQTESSARPAITVFSFVEAAIFLVALGVGVLVLARGDRRAFHLPGGDGLVVTAAGAWATFLIFFRFLDKPGGGGGEQLRVEYGLSWGIFFGLLAALALVAAGLRLRAAGIAEPALPGEAPTPQRDAPATVPPRPRPASDAFEEPRRAERRREREARRASAETPVRERHPTDEDPTRHVAPADAPTRVEPPRRGDTSSFEPPEFELPPPRPRDR